MPGDKVEYGVGEGSCPLCGFLYSKHQIKGIAITNASVEGVKAILAATLAMRQPGRQRTKRPGRQGDEESFGERMLGALVAETSGGHTLKIVASSGYEMNPHVHGWTTADVDVPAHANGAWVNIYGDSITLKGVDRDMARKGCAAVKLLLKLGAMFAENPSKYKGYLSIAMYESPATVLEMVKDRKGRIKKKKKPRPTGKSAGMLEAFCGIDPEYLDAAKSCDACEARIPMMLCSRLNG